MPRVIPSLLLLLILVCAAPRMLCAAKDDVITMKNGDRFTGEIKRLEYGQLIFKSAYMDSSVALDWERVAQITSKERFRVELSDGRNYIGTVRKGEGVERIELAAEGRESELEFEQSEVVVVNPQERSFWQRMDGSIDYGFSFNSGNSQTQSTLSSTLSYPWGRNNVDVSLNQNFSGQTDGQDTKRTDFTFSYRHLFARKWYATSLLGLLQSDQQQLALRSTFGGGAGRSLIRTNRMELRTVFGAVMTREKFSDDGVSTPFTTGGEGIIGVDFSAFKFSASSVKLQSSLFPSFTTPGRYRVSLNLGVYFDIWRDLYWSINIYENYDSKPPRETRKNDFGISMGLGWSF